MVRGRYSEGATLTACLLFQEWCFPNSFISSYLSPIYNNARHQMLPQQIFVNEETKDLKKYSNWTWQFGEQFLPSLYLFPDVGKGGTWKRNTLFTSGAPHTSSPTASPSTGSQPAKLTCGHCFSWWINPKWALKISACALSWEVTYRLLLPVLTFLQLTLPMQNKYLVIEKNKYLPVWEIKLHDPYKSVKVYISENVSFIK